MLRAVKRARRDDVTGSESDLGDVAEERERAEERCVRRSGEEARDWRVALRKQRFPAALSRPG